MIMIAIEAKTCAATIIATVGIIRISAASITARLARRAVARIVAAVTTDNSKNSAPASA